jgi:hypothetical protein
MARHNAQASFARKYVGAKRSAAQLAALRRAKAATIGRYYGVPWVQRGTVSAYPGGTGLDESVWVNPWSAASAAVMDEHGPSDLSFTRPWRDSLTFGEMLSLRRKGGYAPDRVSRRFVVNGEGDISPIDFVPTLYNDLLVSRDDGDPNSSVVTYYTDQSVPDLNVSGIDLV